VVAALVLAFAVFAMVSLLTLVLVVVIVAVALDVLAQVPRQAPVPTDHWIDCDVHSELWYLVDYSLRYRHVAQSLEAYFYRDVVVVAAAQLVEMVVQPLMKQRLV